MKEFNLNSGIFKTSVPQRGEGYEEQTDSNYR